MRAVVPAVSVILNRVFVASLLWYAYPIVFSTLAWLRWIVRV